VYARPIHQGAPLTFGVSGMLWKSSLVMFDRETRSLWSQVTGRAVAGPLRGTALRMLPAIHTRWSVWLGSHPESLVLEKRRPSPRAPSALEPELVLGLVVGDQAVGFPFAALRRSPLAHAALAGRPLLVVFIEPAGTAVAFRREVGGQPLTFHALERERDRWWMEDRETATRWNALTGEATAGPRAGAQLIPVPATQAFLGSWRALYPRGDIWSPD
jgi:hypothetical protein